MYGSTIGKVSILKFASTVNQACCVLPPSENFGAKALAMVSIATANIMVVCSVETFPIWKTSTDAHNSSGLGNFIPAVSTPGGTTTWFIQFSLSETPTIDPNLLLKLIIISNTKKYYSNTKKVNYLIIVIIVDFIEFFENLKIKNSLTQF